ncbi:MAG: SDR family oxidoreductase [Chloroflexi bacterium]|nr:SDR family oxidoreductase [Chloroflexota bacterium]
MATTPFRLDGLVAVVTGGSQGIGGAVSAALAQAGATVAVTNLPAKREDVDAFVQGLEVDGGTARGYDLDVSVASSIAPVFDTIAADLGGLHILVNNAGVSSRMSALDVSEEHWDAVHAVNVKGVFFAAQAASRHMLNAGYGRIVNIASQLVVTSGPNRAVYVSAKGGVVALTKSLATEWATQGITVNAVGPGPTDTPMTRNPDSARNDSTFLQHSPIGRRLQPEEIAGAVVFLASREAGAVNGHHLLVDAGWSVS